MLKVESSIHLIPFQVQQMTSTRFLWCRHPCCILSIHPIQQHLASWILPTTRMAPARHGGCDWNCQRPSRPWSQRIWLALVMSGWEGEFLILKAIKLTFWTFTFFLSNQLVAWTQGQNTLTLAPFTQVTRNILHKTVESSGIAFYQGGYMFTHGHLASALQSPMIWLIPKRPKLAAWPTTMNPKGPVQALARSREKQQRMGRMSRFRFLAQRFYEDLRGYIVLSCAIGYQCSLMRMMMMMALVA